MRDLQIGAAAGRELSRLLRASESRFGPDARDRYEGLIDAALHDLRRDPDRPGVRIASSRRPGLRLYPLRYSRTYTAPEHRVSRPRHLIAFRVTDSAIFVVAFLDEQMDLPRRLSGR